MIYDPHVSDADLLLAGSNELEGSKCQKVLQHIANCPRCRHRMTALEKQLDSMLCPTRLPDPDSLSVHRLHEAMERPLPVRPRPILPYLTVAAALLVGGLIIGRFSGATVAAGPLPDSSLTPGYTRMATRDDVCKLPARDEDHQATAELAQQVFAGYGIDPRPRHYEVDYLIAPALGGADDVRNLWPQPYSAGVWTSRVKDALEDKLRDLVCTGRADLATVQLEIASNWIAAYQKYFQTDHPLPEHVSFIKDRPWE